MELAQAFDNFIRQNRLFAPADRVLVAVSGGVDSVVLAHLLWQRKQKIALAHVNFQLRGAESDGEEQLVRSLGEQWRVPVFVKQFDTKEYAAQKGISIQMAARSLRYAWFEEIRQAEGHTVIATGHNLNDSVETALFHFIRGTGLTGLTGIPSRNGAVVRPLLFASREEILEYAAAQYLQWREDSSNLKDDYTRNAIRQHVLPQLLALNPAFIQSAANTLKHLKGADRNLHFFLHKLKGDPDANGVYQLDKAKLSNLPDTENALFDLLQSFDFTADQVQQMIQCWGQTGTAWNSGAGFRVVMDREAILVAGAHDANNTTIKIEADDLMVRLPDNSRLVFTQATAGAPLPDGHSAILVDAEKVEFPVLLRHWRAGDVFQPFGMKGKRQKIQDFFTNQKLSRLEKEQSWILENGDGQIIWVLGLRMDERFKIEASTTNILKITWIQ